MIDGVPQRPGYQRISQSAKGNLMQIKGAEASAKLGATAHQNTWQRWSHGQFNYRSGSTAAVLGSKKIVSLTPASRLPVTSNFHLVSATSRPSPLHPIISSDCDFEPIGDEPPKQMGDRKHPRRLICSTT